MAKASTDLMRPTRCDRARWGLNLYGFANGDPVTYSDPFGLIPISLLIWGGIALFEAASTAYDYSQAGKTLADADASLGDKGEAVARVAAGYVLPRPGSLYTKGARKLASGFVRGFPSDRTVEHFVRGFNSE